MKRKYPEMNQIKTYWILLRIFKKKQLESYFAKVQEDRLEYQLIKM